MKKSMHTKKLQRPKFQLWLTSFLIDMTETLEAFVWGFKHYFHVFFCIFQLKSLKSNGPRKFSYRFDRAKKTAQNFAHILKQFVCRQCSNMSWTVS